MKSTDDEIGRPSARRHGRRPPTGPTATALLSGAVTPSGPQAAQQVLTQVAETVTAAARAQVAAQAARAPGAGAPGGAVPGGQAPATAAAATPAMQVVTIHPTSAAGRTLPLAASALLWLATLMTSALSILVAPRLRGGRPPRNPAPIPAALIGAAPALALVAGLATPVDAGIPLRPG